MVKIKWFKRSGCEDAAEDNTPSPEEMQRVKVVLLKIIAKGFNIITLNFETVAEGDAIMADLEIFYDFYWPRYERVALKYIDQFHRYVWGDMFSCGLDMAVMQLGTYGEFIEKHKALQEQEKRDIRLKQIIKEAIIEAENEKG